MTPGDMVRISESYREKYDVPAVARLLTYEFDGLVAVLKAPFNQFMVPACECTVIPEDEPKRWRR